MGGWVGSQDVMHYGEHAPVKISRIGIDRLDAQPKQQRRYQDNEPTDLGIMRMGWGQQHKDRQIGLATQHHVPFIAKHGRFALVFLPPRARIGLPPGW